MHHLPELGQWCVLCCAFYCIVLRVPGLLKAFPPCFNWVFYSPNKGSPCREIVSTKCAHNKFSTRCVCSFIIRPLHQSRNFLKWPFDMSQAKCFKKKHITVLIWFITAAKRSLLLLLCKCVTVHSVRNLNTPLIGFAPSLAFAPCSSAQTRQWCHCRMLDLICLPLPAVLWPRSTVSLR